MLNHKVQTLDCGLTLITVPMPSVKSATCLLLCNTGSRYEEAGKEGIAHFFEHMPAKGTQNYPDALTFSSTLDGVGAEFNAYTSKEYTGYYVHAASEHINLALDVVSDMVLAPKLRQSDIDVERGVIIEEINMYHDMPQYHISNLFEQMIYQGSGLSHDIIGNKETVSSFKSEDFFDFLGKWYELGNMVLIIAGDSNMLDDKGLVDNINETFAEKSQAPSTNIQTITNDKLRITNLNAKFSDERLLVNYRETQQAHFILGWPGLKRTDSRRYAASLLSTIIGGFMSSRLFTEVREKRGLCYYIHSDLDRYHDTGFFGASAGVDPKRVEEAVEVTIEQFIKMTNDKWQITKEELEKGKNYTAGKMVLGLEDSQSVASYFGMRQLLEGKIETPEEVLAKIKAVTLEEVQSLAKELIKPEEIRFAIIGPYNNSDKFKHIVNT